jgi:hypothetical protein
VLARVAVTTPRRHWTEANWSSWTSIVLAVLGETEVVEAVDRSREESRSRLNQGIRSTAPGLLA